MHPYSCTARCMTMYFIHKGEKAIEDVRKVSIVKFVHDCT